MENEKYTVLIVDDEPSVLAYLGVLLKPLGVQVLTSASGYSALGLLENQVKGTGVLTVDLVITDWRMKGWDGIRLLTEIRARPYGKIPIILMSGAVTKEQLEIAAKNKADGILLKPIVEADLCAKISAFMASKAKSKV